MFEVRLANSCTLAARDTFVTLTVVAGRCALESGDTRLALSGGDTVLLPAGLGSRLEGSEATVVGAAPTA